LWDIVEFKCEGIFDKEAYVTELVAEISCESVKNESKNWNKMREKTGTK